ncbi:MAG: hypothetical protein JO057_28925 [Chloroflexi bacterium]|nr:hypothetical protein [Chloroflexota bacterium]
MLAVDDVATVLAPVDTAVAEVTPLDAAVAAPGAPLALLETAVAALVGDAPAALAAVVDVAAG